MAVRTQGYRVLDGVLPAVGQPHAMMHLEEWGVVGASNKRRRTRAVFTNTLRALQHLGNHVRISIINYRDYRDPLW